MSRVQETAAVDFVITRGESFEKAVTFLADSTPVDLSGCTATLEAAATRDSATTLISLASTGGTPGLALGGTAGTVTLSISSAITGAYTWGYAVYDLWITYSDGFVWPAAAGTIAIEDSVT